jgi:hypothetical protein
VFLLNWQTVERQQTEWKGQLSFPFLNCGKIQMAYTGTVAHTCNSSYLGGRDREDHGSRPTQAKSLQDSISTNKKKAGRGGRCLSSQLSGSINRIVLQASPRHIHDTLFEK